MRKALLATAALGSLALAPLLSAGAQAANLVQNGGFEMTTLHRLLNPANASGAEVDNNWHYGSGLTGWTSPRRKYLQRPVLWQCGDGHKYRRRYSLHDQLSLSTSTATSTA